jgi:hypothetical protein
MAFTNVWDVATPEDVSPANQFADALRDFKVDVQQRMGAFGAGLAADRETPDSGADADFTGVTYFATDTGDYSRWNGSAWETIVTSGVAIVASVDLVAQAAAIPTTTLFTPSVTGFYLVSTDMITTVAGAGGSTSQTIGWNNGIAARTQLINGSAVVGLGNEQTGAQMVYVASGQNITYAVGFTGVSGPFQYELRLRVQRVA